MFYILLYVKNVSIVCKMMISKLKDTERFKLSHIKFIQVRNCIADESIKCFVVVV